MDGDRWDRVQELFLAAREQPVDASRGWVTEQCGEDRELRDEVLSLLDAEPGSDVVDDLAGSLLAPLAGQPEAPALPGARVGAYRVVGELGRGGMARVYLAERDDGQFQQQVAIKVLRRDHGDLARRFLHERRILAGLAHPHIARLLDGGALEDGAPYLVMEYVDGVPVDRWVEEQTLGVRATVELVLQICDAVQFAHRNLVVHRDLKPSNILVTDEGHVRLLDFGIAKLLSDETPELTRPFGRVLTPEYASPEQIAGHAVTTATDVYALGLLLYRLLSGVSAQPASGLTDGELRRRVCEVEPSPVSRAVSRPERRRELRGDLDTIVARALAKVPDRRYGSPGELADDLRRWLDGRPVHARPDGAGYRMGKFVQRHRPAVIGAALAVLALITGLAGTLWQAGEATRERDLARRAAAESEQVTRFMVDLFQAADPMLAGGDTLTARELLERGRQRVDRDLAARPGVRAAMLQAMGDAYLNLGQHDRADTLLGQARDLIAATSPVDSLELADALVSLGRLDQARGEFQTAVARLRTALGIQRRHAGDRDPTTAAAWNNLGAAYMALERADSAAACYGAALAVRRADPETTPIELGVVMANLASATVRLGRAEAADSLFARADSLMQTGGGADHPQRAILLGNWGVMRYRLGDIAGAAERVAASLAIHRRILGDDHPQVGRGENNLAAILERQGRDDEAEPHYRESLRIKRTVLGPEHPSVASTLNNLALLLQRRGAMREAESLLRESAAIREGALPKDHPQVARGWYNLARLLHDTGRHAEAEPLYRRALDLRARVLGDDHDGTRAAAQSLAGLLRDLDRIDGATALEARYGLTLHAD